MRKRNWINLCSALLVLTTVAAPAHAVVRGKPVHGLALYGEPKVGPNESFSYNNVNAPKGGVLRLAAPAPTFDTLNSFSMKGVSAAGLTYLGTNSIFVEGLTLSSEDEPFTQYCLLCETMEIGEDNTWIEYTLRAEARFHDGTSVTPEDVITSFNLLREKGMPAHRMYWSDVAKVEKTGPLKIKFTFKTATNSELALIIGQLPILNKNFWEAHDLAGSTLDVPVSTGPYKIDSFEPGRFISYKRDPNYWGKDLPITRGTYNFDEIRFEYFRDDTVAFEAFKTNAYDAVQENTARRWATGYDFPAATDGRVQKLVVRSGTPMYAQAFTFNLRRAKFADRRVRQALNYAFDFESLNKTIFYEQYKRIRSYWQNSDLEAKGLPSPEEVALLEPLRDKIPPEVFTQEFVQPTTAGDGNPRDNLLKAKQLLTEAGWDVVNGVLTNKKSGEAFTFELISTQSTLDRIILPWFQNLEKLGIKGSLRIIDASQIVNRMNDYDFDVTIGGVNNSLSPGNEQTEYWGADAADRPGSRNLSGVKDPAVDALITTMLSAKDRAALATTTKALDRVLTWNFYTGLQYGSEGDRFAYWSKLQHPERFPLQGVQSTAAIATNWWFDANAQTTPTTTAAAPSASTEAPSSNKNGLIALVTLALVSLGYIIYRRTRK
jgi:microcin C transport system substrate-binding protein